MKHCHIYTKKIVTLMAVTCLLCFGSVYAASVTVHAPTTSSSQEEVVVVGVTLDPEGSSLSGVSGEFSFNSSLFDVEKIILDGSVVHPWVTKPTIRKDIVLDGRVYIYFEGIFAGGFDGVRSPHYEGVKEGLLFKVLLRPKKAGRDTLTAQSNEAYLFNEKATKILLNDSSATITIHKNTLLTQSQDLTAQDKKRIPASFSTTITTSNLLPNNAPIIIVEDKQRPTQIDSIYVTENTSPSHPDRLSKEWKQYSTVYPLRYVDRSRYVHVMVVYSDETYAISTIKPVENLEKITSLSTILVSIWFVTVFVMILLYAIKRRSQK